MKSPNLAIFLITLTFIQIISSSEEINNNPDSSGYISSIPYLSPSSLENNGPECLSKDVFFNLLNRRDRRASISRPYFHHWRGSRDDTRYVSKNIQAFSPRLGKRSIEDESESFALISKRRSEEEQNKSSDLETFLLFLINQLQKKQVDIVYEDSTKICLSQALNDTFLQEIMVKFHAFRRRQDQDEQQSKSKHPLLFRYRLG